VKNTIKFYPTEGKAKDTPQATEKIRRRRKQIVKKQRDPEKTLSELWKSTEDLYQPSCKAQKRTVTKFLMTNHVTRGASAAETLTQALTK